MKNNFIKFFSFFLSISILLVSCKSNTVIYSSPIAKVYKKGKYLGETPYRHGDFKLTGMGTKFQLEAEGYKDLEVKIRRFERVHYGAIYFGFIAFLPFLWTGQYNFYQSYNLKPKDKSKKIKADYIKYKDAFKSDKRGFPIYIGQDDRSHYAYIGGEVIEMSSQFQEKNRYEIENSGKGYLTGPIDAFIVDDNKHVLDIDASSDILTVNTLTASGETYSTKLNNIKHIREMVNADYQFGYDRAESTNNIIAYNSEELFRYNDKFELIKKHSSNGSYLEAKITNDGKIISLETDDQNVYLTQTGLTNKQETVEFVEGKNMSNFRLNVDEDRSEIFITYLVGPLEGSSKSKRSKRNRDSDTYVNGVHIITYDLNSLKQKSSKTINFDSTIYEKATYASKEKDALKFIVNKGVVANENNVYVNLEEQWITIVSSDKSVTEYLNACGIITINAAKENNPMAFITKRGLSSYEYQRLSFNQILSGDKIHYLFNDNVAAARPIVQQIIFDSDMNRLSQDIYDIKKEEKTLLNTARSYKLDNGERLIFHARKKRFGAAIIDFELDG